MTLAEGLAAWKSAGVLRNNRGCLRDFALGELLNEVLVQYSSGCVASGFGAREPWGLSCICGNVPIRSTYRDGLGSDGPASLQ